MSHTDRVVVLVDMDCFYCQVEENLDPQLKGKPLAVVQYNTWRGGGIIAVNYLAREQGVTRHMRGDEAKRKCPQIELVHVPSVRGKADLTKYRDAGKLVASVLQKFTPLLERASVDEAYLDITDAVAVRSNFAKSEIQLSQVINTHVVGCETLEFLYSLYNFGLCDEANLKLAYGAVIAEEIRAAVFRETGYTCSAGIAHNKILAKLAAGLNKPNRQTLLPQDGVESLYKDLPVRKIRSLGGKFGDSLSEDLGITTMAELERFSHKDLRKRYDDKTASWLYNIARGIDLEPVTIRLVSKSIGCAKTFPGRNALIKPESLRHWLGELSAELVERLEKDLEENNRRAKQMTVGFTHDDISASRVHGLSSYDAKKIADDCYALVQKHCVKADGTFCVTNLSINAGKFEDCRNVTAITSFFKSKTVETSDYSDETIDLNEDTSKLSFYKEADASNDSITTEIRTLEEDEAKGSFFLQYFEDMKNSKKRESPVLRDFDTSRNLEDDDAPSTSNGTEICDECNRKVSIAEMTSHKDHHLALQIAKEEKLARLPTITIKGKENAKSKKRKSSDAGTLTKFLQSAAILPEDESEVCPQCQKRIGRNDLAAHLDYHLARELHREINQIKSCSSETAQRSSKKTKTTKAATKNTRSVISFFKPN
ncbi:hypothetical protein PPYR_14025 [Photinus pyralis]|uniref:DNA polymerase eta n=3 Tax=Photinus pyralis TaxID=7054 RepID=A0A5N4A3Z6_PHOPY|nr:DNA polymerase eta [Photinus pyralis]KAB0792064.1 hypothetical protein PPYR_14025 [Photinus pyralis]